MIRLPALLCCLAAVPTLLAGDSTGSRQLDQFIRGGAIYLTLNDAITLAVANNLDLELQRFNTRLADQDLRRAQSGATLRGVPLTVREGPKSVSRALLDAPASPLGPGPETNLSIAGSVPLSGGSLPVSLDPVLVARFTHSQLTTPQLNSFLVGTPALKNDFSAWNAGWQKGFLSGAQVSASFENTHQNINHRRYDLAPFYTSAAGISFTQPLLRGFGRSLNSRFVRIAGNNRQQSELVFRQQVITTVATVVKLYWDLVSLNEDVKVRRQNLEKSEKLLADNEAQFETGTRARIEVVRARAEVARSRRDLIAAESLVRQQETVLKDYLMRDTVAGSGLRATRIIPVDPLRVDQNFALPDLESLAAQALRDRPDLIQAGLQLDSSREALKGSADALRPAVDLIASARHQALVGETNPLTVPGAPPRIVDPLLLGGYGSALGQLFRRSFPDVTVGIQVSLPLRNRAAEADHARDGLVLRQQEVRMRQLRKQVYVEIENAVIALQQAREVLLAAASERALQEEALAAEQEKLSVGASTTYLLIQYQRDLVEARAAEIAAQAGVVKAKAHLDRASGSLLAELGVVVTGSEVITR